MGNRDNPVTVYLTDAEKQKLDRWSDEVDKPLSQLCRDAILEYTDRDRTERIEHEVRDVNDKLDRVLSLVDGEHAHTSGGQKSVPEKARSVAQHLYRNHETPIQEKDVVMAIENIADVGDERSVGKYKEQLKKRELLFEHPNSPVWTDDKEEWVGWVEGAYHNPDIHEVTAEYGMSTTEYAQLAGVADEN